MISLSKFLECVKKNINRVRQYLKGRDGTNGYCDCIGLIIGSLRLAGLTWKETHGSNYAFRYKIKNAQKLTASNAYVGEVVFKYHTPNEDGYDADTIKSKYKNHPDQNDYYHAGIVTSVNPLVITHCTGVEGGIKRDTKIGAWRIGGQIDGVDYGDASPTEEEVIVIMQNATVVGGDLNIRANKSTASKRLGGIPDGSRVEVITNDGTWAAVDYKGTGGFVLSKYLQFDDCDGADTIKVSKPLLMNVYNAISEMLGVSKEK